MAGYEDAPATKMVASHCAVCSRPLLDAKSVEMGIGPDCRRRHGYDLDVSEEARKEANLIVHYIAVDQEGPAVGEACDKLRSLGFVKLADRILERVAPVRIIVSGEMMEVHTPYRPEVVTAMRGIKGRRWDKERKVNTFPVSAKPEVWTLIKTHFAGLVGRGPSGTFHIPSN